MTAQLVSIEEYVRRVPLSKSTVQRLIAQRKIPVFQPGGPGTRVLLALPDDSSLQRSAITDNLAKDSLSQISTLEDSNADISKATTPRRGPRPNWTKGSSRTGGRPKSNTFSK